MSAPADVIRFVRETLGCGCPDEVVDRTVVEAFPGGPEGLDVGGRLLVRVVRADDLDVVMRDLHRIVERYRQERDRRGFNRLRIVAVHPDPVRARLKLEPLLSLTAAVDDRVHLHTVAAEELPTGLRPAD